MGQISLVNNYFNILGDSIAIYLPYYGKNQMGGLAYNTTNGGGIKFDGVPKEFTIKENKYPFKSNR